MFVTRIEDLELDADTWQLLAEQITQEAAAIGQSRGLAEYLPELTWLGTVVNICRLCSTGKLAASSRYGTAVSIST